MSCTHIRPRHLNRFQQGPLQVLVTKLYITIQQRKDPLTLIALPIYRLSECLPCPLIPQVHQKKKTRRDKYQIVLSAYDILQKAFCDWIVLGHCKTRDYRKITIISNITGLLCIASL